MVFHHQTVLKTHDLEHLLELCAEKYFAILVLKKEILSLESYEIKPRYPDDHFTIDRSDVERGIKIAEQLLKIITQYLNIKI